MTSSLADPAELRDHIRTLGLQSIRAKRLIALSAAYAYEYAYRDDDHDRDHTPISHLPGSGPYAIDSYRIYCGGPDAWRTVVPRDKELIRFIVRLFTSERRSMNQRYCRSGAGPPMGCSGPPRSG